MPYVIMARRSPWVTPSLLCKKWPDPSPMSLSTSVATVTVTVKGKLRATGPLVLDSPEHGCPVLLIERVARVNEEKPPILLILKLLPEDAHRVYGALYPRLQASRQLRHATGGLGLRPGYLE